MNRSPRFLLILLLFAVLRLMMMAVFPADNLTLFGDYAYYYELAAYSDQGQLPFIHYWSEYPPLFPFLSVAIYQLGHLFGGGYHVYVYLTGLVMIGCNTANLALFLRLARRLRGDDVAERLGWIYALLFVPLIYTWWNFDALTLLSLLLALELLLSGHERWSAAAVGLGAMVKLVPLLVLPAVVRSRPWRRWLVYGLIAAGVIAAIALPLLLAGGQWAWTSFRSPGGWSSWQTVWALIDGNLRTGLLGAPELHFDLARATAPVGNPARIPEPIRLLVFGVLGGILFWKAELRQQPRRTIAFVALTLVVFFLWSKGWSPQWQSLLFPLLLLTLPLPRSVLFILVFSMVNLAEWPVLLSRNLFQWLYVTVPLRTALLALLAVDLWRRVKS